MSIDNPIQYNYEDCRSLLWFLGQHLVEAANGKWRLTSAKVWKLVSFSVLNLGAGVRLTAEISDYTIAIVGLRSST